MRKDRGFSLIEVIVAMGLTVLVTSAATSGLLAQMRLNTLAQERSRAASVATQVFEEYRIQDPASLPTSGTATQTVTIDGQAYGVRVDFCLRSNMCSSSLRHLTVTVQKNGVTYYEIETAFAGLR